MITYTNIRVSLSHRRLTTVSSEDKPFIRLVLLDTIARKKEFLKRPRVTRFFDNLNRFIINEENRFLVTASLRGNIFRLGRVLYKMRF